jgi:chromosome segregation ATPase
MRRILPLLLVVGVVLSGCKAKEAMDKASVARDLEKRGTVDLMKEISNDKYDPPKDGRLTDGQIQMYMKVREHEKVIAQVAKAEAEKHAKAADKAGDKSISGMMEGFKTMGAAAEMLTADLRAAKDLHYNTAEYQWVKGQILAASTSAYAEKMGQALNATMESSYQQMKKQYDEAKDEQTKQAYKQMLDSMEQQRGEAAKQKEAVDPAIAYNRQILSKYENALNAYAHELSKYEDKPGEAKKSVDEFQKNIDKAVQDAKNPKQ